MLPPLCLPGCTPVRGPAGDMGNSWGSSSAQVPPPSTAAGLATGVKWPVRGRGGRAEGVKRAKWKRRMLLAYRHGQGCQSILCNRFGYGGAVEKLISVILEWKEVPCQARQTGGEKHKKFAVGCRKRFGTFYSLVNNSAALYVHSVELFSTTAV